MLQEKIGLLNITWNNIIFSVAEKRDNSLKVSIKSRLLKIKMLIVPRELIDLPFIWARFLFLRFHFPVLFVERQTELFLINFMLLKPNQPYRNTMEFTCIAITVEGKLTEPYTLNAC